MSTDVRPQKEERIYLRVTREMKREIEAAARTEHRTISNWLERLVLGELERRRASS